MRPFSIFVHFKFFQIHSQDRFKIILVSIPNLYIFDPYQILIQSNHSIIKLITICLYTGNAEASKLNTMAIIGATVGLFFLIVIGFLLRFVVKMITKRTGRNRNLEVERKYAYMVIYFFSFLKPCLNLKAILIRQTGGSTSVLVKYSWYCVSLARWMPLFFNSNIVNASKCMSASIINMEYFNQFNFETFQDCKRCWQWSA